MRPCPRRPIPAPRQRSLLPALTGPGQLTAEERREAVALLAALLTEAASPASPETTDERD
jgi:hypothetical protein